MCFITGELFGELWVGWFFTFFYVCMNVSKSLWLSINKRECSIVIRILDNISIDRFCLNGFGFPLLPVSKPLAVWVSRFFTKRVNPCFHPLIWLWPTDVSIYDGYNGERQHFSICSSYLVLCPHHEKMLELPCWRIRSMKPSPTAPVIPAKSMSILISRSNCPSDLCVSLTKIRTA